MKRAGSEIPDPLVRGTEYGFADLNPHPNVTDSKHCLQQEIPENLEVQYSRNFFLYRNHLLQNQAFPFDQFVEKLNKK
jgi:hypothetical protein